MGTLTKTTTVWEKDEEFKSFHDTNEIQIDGNKKNGYGAKALLLAGVSACSAIDVVGILKKQRVEFSDFSVDAESEQTDDHPKVFKDIYITYKIKTDPANEEKVKKAIDLSLDKYCGVSAMLKKNSPIHYKLQIL